MFAHCAMVIPLSFLFYLSSQSIGMRQQVQRKHIPPLHSIQGVNRIIIATRPLTVNRQAINIDWTLDKLVHGVVRYYSHAYNVATTYSDYEQRNVYMRL